MSSKARLLLGGLALAIAGCGGLSNVGEQPKLAPTAVAQVVGYSGPNDAGDSTATVRARSELLLTGKESIEADKPILGFQWKAVNAANDKYITVRNTSTINVSVPAVTIPTDLQYQLTVTDSDGDTDSSMVTLHVQPILDSDRFLSFVGKQARLRIVAATPQPSAGGHFSVQLRAKVTYATRPSTLTNKVMNTVEYDVGAPIEGDWIASSAPAGINPPERDYRNPVLEAPIPAVNLDDIIRTFQATLPGSAASTPDPAFVDVATVEVIAKLTTTSAIGTMSLTAVDAAGTSVGTATNGGTGMTVELHLLPAVVDALRLSGGGLENSETAASYYSAIDPQNQKLTLTDWLTQNCFNESATNLGADAHAVYVNNFDLGFGRDMYFIGSKPAGCTSTSFAPGNAASVVINYATLEGAVKKVDPVIAVAMEYRNADVNRGTPGTVVFYIFAPDQGTGEFRRVGSANFDGRGEKYLPGACLICHGGRPRTNAANPHAPYANGDANVSATFMPWDLESFLFSNTDPSFPTDGENAALAAQFSRVRQEGEFKKLNLGVFATYGSRNGTATTCYPAFTGPCDLVKLWYGDDLSGSLFNNSAVGKGWRTGFVGTGNPLPPPNPATAEDLYRDVFARNCRACHTQRIGELDPNQPLDPQFATYSDFLKEKDKIHSLVFDLGSMPGARLTADRLWTVSRNSETAGAELARHLGFDPAVVPGASVAKIAVSQLNTNPQPVYTLLVADPGDATLLVANRKRPLRIDGSDSAFPNGFTQTVVVPAGSAATLLGANNALAQLTPDLPGLYTFTLKAAPTGARATVVQNVDVRNIAPVLPSSETFLVDQGASVTQTAANGILNGVTDGDGDTLTVTPTSGSVDCPAVAHATQLTVQTDGGFFYQNNGNIGSTDQFEVSITDGFVVQTLCIHLTIRSVPDSQPPTAPGLNAPSAGFVDSTSNSRFPVSLSWSAATDTDQFNNPRTLGGYTIYRRPTSGGGEIQVGTTANNILTFTDTTAGNVLLPNTSYTYRVAAVDQNGNSTYSAGQSVTTRSSFRQDVHPIFTNRGCTGCHAIVTGNADTVYADAGFQAVIDNGRLPCHPAECDGAHTSGRSLSDDPNDNSQAGIDYRQILKWIQEGRHNN